MNKIIIHVIAFCAIFTFQNVVSSEYYPHPTVKSFINKDGELVIKTQFYDAKQFSEGLAPVKLAVLNGVLVYNYPELKDDEKNSVKYKWGFIDKTGEVIIFPQFDDALPFSEGLAAVMIINEKNEKLWGFINRQGKLEIKFKYSVVGSFSEGLANVLFSDLLVSQKSNKYAYINSSDEIILPPQYDTAYPFYENLARVKVNGSRYFINNNGEAVINLTDFDGASFNDGWAFVQYKAGTNEMDTCYVDKKGEIVFSKTSIKVPQGDDINYYGFNSNFSEGITVISKKYSGSGYISKDGTILVSPIFYSAQQFSDGMGLVIQRIDHQSEYSYTLLPDERYSYVYHYLNKSGEKLLTIGSKVIINLVTGKKYLLSGEIINIYSFRDGLAIIEYERSN